MSRRAPRAPIRPRATPSSPSTSRLRRPAEPPSSSSFQSSIWNKPTALATAQEGLAALPEFEKLTGPLNPNGVTLTVNQLTQLRTQLGPAQALPPVPATNAVPVQLYNAYRATGQLISPDGRTIQFSAETNGGDTSSPSALDSVPGMRADLDRVGQAAGASATGLLGALEFSYDVAHISNSDLERIIPLVALLIAILLAAVMRSLVAPLYLVASVVLSYLAALGLTGIIFVHLGGQDGLNFVLPFLMFVFLMALGSDYNILVMSRIREEAHRLPLRDAVAKAVGKTGSTVTTAAYPGAASPCLAIAAGGTAGGADPADRVRRGRGRADGYVPRPLAARAGARRAAGTLELVAVGPRTDRRRGGGATGCAGCRRCAELRPERAVDGDGRGPAWAEDAGRRPNVRREPAAGRTDDGHRQREAAHASPRSSSAVRSSVGAEAPPSVKTVVVGAGVIGLCTAYSLRRRGIDVEVLTAGTLARVRRRATPAGSRPRSPGRCQARGSCPDRFAGC